MMRNLALWTVAVIVNPLRIFASGTRVSAIRVGWRCTTVGPRSCSLYQDALSRPLPTADSSSWLSAFCYHSEQETSVAAQHNRLIAARHWNALRPFLTHLTPTPEVVCAERRFRQHRKPTVLHEKNAD